MKTETREIYKCDHCRKMYQRKNMCEYHEKICNKNPDNLRPCHNCNFCKKQRETIWGGFGDQFGNEVEISVEVLFCSEIDSYIYPPRVAIKGNAFDMGYASNIEMPKTCDKFKQREY